MNEDTTVDYESNDNGARHGRTGDGRDRGPRQAEIESGGEPSYLPDDMAEAIGRARTWVTHNPLAAIGVAVAAGFVVGRVFRGSR